MNMNTSSYWTAYAFVIGVALLPASTLATPPAGPNDPDRTPAHQDRLAQRGECPQRVGPFATQDTAWQRLHQARGQGYPVSNGIYPCYDSQGTRGYCFNVFVRC
jgi:hypothetical protein